LISDAIHNLSDGISGITGYGAIRLSKKQNNEKMTFGYKRAEILAALFNSSLLMVIAIYLMREAYDKLISPVEIKGYIMTGVALFGLAANVSATFLIKRHEKSSINMRAIYLHLLSDSVSSVGVIIGGIAIILFDINIIDPLITFLIGIYIIRESYLIIKKALTILMEGIPENMDIEEIKKNVEMLENVENIHHIHIWQTDDRDIHLTCHVDVSCDMGVKDADRIRANIEKLLTEKFNISHMTIQMEQDTCTDKDILGKMECNWDDE